MGSDAEEVSVPLAGKRMQVCPQDGQWKRGGELPAGRKAGAKAQKQERTCHLHRLSSSALENKLGRSSVILATANLSTVYSFNKVNVHLSRCLFINATFHCSYTLCT